MRAVPVVALFTLREAVRRKVFAVVLVLTVAFVALYAFGADHAFHDVAAFNGSEVARGVDGKTLAGATLQGLAMFATLFLGTVLAVFLTLSAVRGDAERGLLQPLVVRPVGRGAFLFARFAGAASVCALYVGALYAVTVVVTGLTGGWWPDRLVMPGVELAVAVVVVVALSLLGSVLLSSTANGIAVFMLFGAGLTAGLLGQVGRAISVAHADPGRPARLVRAPVRGALPGRAQPAHRRHRRRDRVPAAARAVRRGAGRRLGARALARRLPASRSPQRRS